jgi:hypothetical protein
MTRKQKLAKRAQLFSCTHYLEKQQQDKIHKMQFRYNRRLIKAGKTPTEHNHTH